jgi:hypothetical protein
MNKTPENAYCCSCLALLLERKYAHRNDGFHYEDDLVLNLPLVVFPRFLVKKRLEYRADEVLFVLPLVVAGLVRGRDDLLLLRRDEEGLRDDGLEVLGELLLRRRLLRRPAAASLVHHL